MLPPDNVESRGKKQACSVKCMGKFFEPDPIFTIFSAIPESARRFYSLTIALTFANASLVTDALAFSAKRMPLAEKSIIFTC